MCDFCVKIYGNMAEYRKLHNDRWRMDTAIIKEDDGTFSIFIPAFDDPWYDQDLWDVRYCPYCGRKL